MTTLFPSQDLENPSSTKMMPSNSRGGGDRSGPSSSSSRRCQEQVPEDNLMNEIKALVKEPNITSHPPRRSESVDLTPSDRSGGGDQSRAPCPRSLTEEEQVKNLKENLKLIIWSIYGPQGNWDNIMEYPWFAYVVKELRDDSCLESDTVKKVGVIPLDHIYSYRYSFEVHRQVSLDNIPVLHMAVFMGDLQMVRKILVKNNCKINLTLIDKGLRYSALDLAIVCGEDEIVDALVEKKAEFDTNKRGSLQLAVLHAAEAPKRRTKNYSTIIQSLASMSNDIGAQDKVEYSAFYIAVVKGRTDIVIELLKWKKKIHLNEVCRGGRPPIQIAKEERFNDMVIELMDCPDVKDYIEEALRDRQAYVDAANAILVGAALIASVTFASWLQPPLNYTTSYHDSSMKYVDVEHNFALGSFWVFNTLSFYFAIGTVVFGAHSVLPRRQLFITETVKKLSKNLVLTSILLAFSVLFVIVAFGNAGFIVLIPILRYRWYMIAPTIFGGLVCVGSVGYLFKSLWNNWPWNSRRKFKSINESLLIDYYYHEVHEKDDVEPWLQ